MRKFSPVRIVRLLLATTLSLWVAGAGCILGCEGMIASAASGGGIEATHHSDKGQTVVASGDACSSGEASKSHDCCKKSPDSVTPATPTKSSNASLLELSGSSSGAMNGCPLAVSRASVVAKTRETDLNSAPALAQSVLPELESAERTAPLSSPLHLPNRGHTYLRCCVFLI